ncbi:MAG TPA: SitI3 family protein [Pseudonocardiaceae bacterium]|nr:SitI3 family protein [Pseudonocardiaceae bacterium]
MAIGYSFAFATGAPATCVAGAMLAVPDVFGATATVDGLLGDGVLTRTGMWVRVGPEHSRPHDPVLEDFGFLPTVWASFRLDKFTDMSSQEDDMVRLLVGVLGRIAGDAVLHFQFETVWLLRKDGELTLNERDEHVWTPTRLAAVHLPYRRVTHSFQQ